MTTFRFTWPQLVAKPWSILSFLSPKIAVNVKLMTAVCFRYFWQTWWSEENYQTHVSHDTKMHLHPCSKSISYQTFALNSQLFSRVIFFVLAVSLSLLHLCCYQFFLLFFSPASLFQMAQLPTLRISSGWYRSITNYKTPSYSCLCLELHFMLVGILF